MIEQIEEESANRGGGAVGAVYVRIGVLSGVDAEALRFAFELAREGTLLAESRLEIEPVPLLVYCPQCASTHAPDPWKIVCPDCVKPPQQILQGRELEITAFEFAA
jgi:hydrogenase nickel incorporation protein HypA/HybF